MMQFEQNDADSHYNNLQSLEDMSKSGWQHYRHLYPGALFTPCRPNHRWTHARPKAPHDRQDRADSQLRRRRVPLGHGQCIEQCRQRRLPYLLAIHNKRWHCTV